MKKIYLFILVFFMSGSLVNAENDHHHDVSKQITGVESLSPELRKLLLKEMRELQKGMMSIIPAYAFGNWDEIENIGSKMEKSYILKQSITEEQIEELHGSLPSQFIKLDQQFHYFAGMLSHAAEKRKPELVGFYFSKLNESCFNCHSQYATHKFKGLIEPDKTNAHSH